MAKTLSKPHCGDSGPAEVVARDAEAADSVVTEVTEAQGETALVEEVLETGTGTSTAEGLAAEDETVIAMTEAGQGTALSPVAVSAIVIEAVGTVTGVKVVGAETASKLG